MSTFVRMDWAVFGLCTRNVKFPIGPQGDLRVFSQVPHAAMGSSTNSLHSPMSAYSMNPLYWLYRQKKATASLRVVLSQTSDPLIFKKTTLAFLIIRFEPDCHVFRNPRRFVPFPTAKYFVRQQVGRNGA